MQKKWLLVAAVPAVALGLAGCGALLTLEASRSIYDQPQGKNDVQKKPFENDEFLVETARRYGLMALFAETAYRGELLEKDRDELSCSYLKPGWSGDAQYGMPKDATSNAGWQRWIPTGDGEAPCVNDRNGLFYETYVYRDAAGVMQEVVIAYRGTENRAGQTAWDWTTNGAAAFGFEPAQYALARERLPGLIKRIREAKDANPKAPIFAVGHSLGGGLAQQAGYLSREIQEVYTFNTSPVTNWTHLRRAGLVDQGYPIIHRLYHGGEGLELPRFVATSATSARYGRHDVGVQFGGRQFASGHSMKILACNFARILSKRKATAVPHEYPLTFIDSRVLKIGDAGTEQPPSDKSRRICDDDKPGTGHDDQVSK